MAIASYRGMHTMVEYTYVYLYSSTIMQGGEKKTSDIKNPIATNRRPNNAKRDIAVYWNTSPQG